jgi:signal transduction histidine kinase
MKIFTELKTTIPFEEFLEVHQSSQTIFSFYSWHILLLATAMVLKSFGVVKQERSLSIFTLMRLISLIPIVFHLYDAYQRKYQPGWRSQPFRISHIENAYLFSLTVASSAALIGASLQSDCRLPLCENVLPGQMQPALLFQNIMFGILSPILVKAHHVWVAWLTFFISFVCTIVAGVIVGVSTSSYFSLIAIYFLGAIVLYDNERTLRQLYQNHRTQEENLMIKLTSKNEQELSKLKDSQLRKLFGNVAHDFKTPLQSFILELELLENTISSHHAQSIAMLKSICSYMLMMVNRAVDYSKVSSGIQLVPSLDKVNVAAILSWVMTCVRSDDLSHIPIHIEPFSPDLCLNVTTDLQWLRENLLCLVSNALKFTSSPGEITIRCHLESSIHSSDRRAIYCHGISQRSSDQLRGSSPHVRSSCRTDSGFGSIRSAGTTKQLMQFLRFEVEDNGIGVEMEKQSDLYQPFKQIDQHGGTGLGLFSLAKRCESLGGQYGFMNRKDQQRGSCFWFTIPYHPDLFSSTIFQDPFNSIIHEDIADLESTGHVPVLAHTRAPVHNPSPTSSLPPSASSSSPRLHLKILLVEDSILIQKTTTRVLTREGYQVDIAKHGAECLEMIQKKRYDFIIMDINMPVMDGIEATRRIRENEQQILHLPQIDPLSPSSPSSSSSPSPSSPATTPNPNSHPHSSHLPPLCIIGISANSDTNTIKQSLEVGMNDFLSKPLSLVQLKECFRRLKNDNI